MADARPVGDRRPPTTSSCSRPSSRGAGCATGASPTVENGDVALPSAAGIPVGLTNREAILAREEPAPRQRADGQLRHHAADPTAQGTFGAGAAAGHAVDASDRRPHAPLHHHPPRGRLARRGRPGAARPGRRAARRARPDRAPGRPGSATSTRARAARRTRACARPASTTPGRAPTRTTCPASPAATAQPLDDPADVLQRADRPDLHARGHRRHGGVAVGDHARRLRARACGHPTTLAWWPGSRPRQLSSHRSTVAHADRRSSRPTRGVTPAG